MFYAPFSWSASSLTIASPTDLEPYMTTALGLSALAASPGIDAPPELGDLSLSLAGAELVDLVDLQAVLLNDGRLLPAASPRIQDDLLLEAASTIIRDAPYETVEQWLWRRGRDLAARYRRALEATVSGTPAHSSRRSFRRSRPLPVVPPAVDPALGRMTDGRPVVVALAAAARIVEAADETLGELDPDEAAVVGAVHQAVTRLAAERQRRSIERVGFDDIARGF
ncbi:GPP34 family phosphoprotein [Streptomyces nigra]|uniref:GPP34 family phosphoprotein n=1 Tax=Streptomyces nigra TaxID=1827580 RepID=UPI00367990A5